MKMTFGELRTNTFNSLQRHSPEILVGLGIAGFVMSTVFAIRATPKACVKIKDEEKRNGGKKLTRPQVVKATWKYYIPTAVSAAVSTACIIGSSKISLQRNAALAAAYAVSEQALRTYSQKVIETIGENKEKQIYDEIMADKVRSHPVHANEVIFVDGCQTLCYDPFREKYFMVNLDKVRNGIATLNERMYSEMYVSLNDAYCEMGLPPVTTDPDVGNIGERNGWCVEHGAIKLKPTSTLTENGTPCYVLGFDPPPRADYMFA